LGSDAFSPYRDTRYCCAPKPGKEKQKSYDYRSAILMVHRFRFFLSVFTPVLRKIWREVTRKNQKTDEPRITRMSRIRERSARRLGFGWRLTQTPYNCHRICNSAVAPCRIFLNDPISVLSVVKLFLLFLAEFLKSEISAQRIPDRIKS
jgi:hypothetical protein